MGFVDRVIEGALRQRVLVLVGVVLLVGLGVWSVLRIPIDAFPDVTNIQVEVLSTSPGMSPPEVERFVTYPVETAMRGLPRLAQVRSVSKAGLSVVTVVFEDGVDIYFARASSSVSSRPGSASRPGPRSPWDRFRRPWGRSINTRWPGAGPQAWTRSST
jgi:Cu/Ag efflux pump CusA